MAQKQSGKQENVMSTPERARLRNKVLPTRVTRQYLRYTTRFEIGFPSLTQKLEKIIFQAYPKKGQWIFRLAAIVGYLIQSKLSAVYFVLHVCQRSTVL
jgi:hypothetical protein